MSIVEANFQFRLSGGSSNATGAASLGGAISSEAMPETIDGLFGAISAAQAAAGITQYRCVYLRNGNATDLMTAARNWIEANTPLAGTTLSIGVGTAAVNGVEQTIASETTAPSGVSFSAPDDAADGIALGNIPATQHKAIWFRRTTSPGAGNSQDDPATLGFDCETT